MAAVKAREQVCRRRGEERGRDERREEMRGVGETWGERRNGVVAVCVACEGGRADKRRKRR